MKFFRVIKGTETAVNIFLEVKSLSCCVKFLTKTLSTKSLNIIVTRPVLNKPRQTIAEKNFLTLAFSKVYKVTMNIRVHKVLQNPIYLKNTKWGTMHSVHLVTKCVAHTITATTGW